MIYIFDINYYYMIKVLKIFLGYFYVVFETIKFDQMSYNNNLYTHLFKYNNS